MLSKARRDKPRRLVIITLSASIAGSTAALAASFERIGTGIAIAMGYMILFMSALLMNVFIHNGNSEMKRLFLLAFTLCVFSIFLGGITYILFSTGTERPAAIHAEMINNTSSAHDSQSLINTREAVDDEAELNAESMSEHPEAPEPGNNDDFIPAVSSDEDDDSSDNQQSPFIADYRRLGCSD